MSVDYWAIQDIDIKENCVSFANFRYLRSWSDGQIKRYFDLFGLASLVMILTH